MHKWFVGAFLTLVMVIALGTNALLFSARSFQDNLQNLAPNTNGVLNLSLYEDVDRRVTEAEEQVKGVRGQAIDLQRQAAEFESAAQKSRSQAGELVGLVRVGLARYEAEGEAPAVVDGVAQGVALAARLETAARKPNLKETDRQQIAALLALTADIDRLNAAAEEQTVEAATRRAQAAKVGLKASETDQEVLALKAQFLGETPARYATALASDAPDSFAIIRNEATALVRSSPYRVTAHLAQVHPQFLSITLVLLMGLLGGVLYLFPAYMSRPNPVTFAEIFIRMIFGMCTALAFYIVMNAAVAGFSLSPQTAVSQDPQTTINPFSVSLVGIIAGVMADDIARWIHQRGTELLGGRPGQSLPASDPAAVDANAPVTGGGAQGPGAAAGF